MKYQYHILIIFLAISCLSVHCKKDKEPISWPLSQGFKDYIYFKDDTYWVYQDSITKYNDSVWVTESTIYTTVDEIDKGWKKKKMEVEYELFDYKTRSNSNSKILEYYSNSWASCVSRNDTDGSFCFSCWRKRIDIVSEYSSDVFFYEPIESTEAGSVTLTNVFDSLKINNITFKSVCRIYDTQNYTENGYETVFYIAKNIGIIRKEIEYKQGKWEIWNLIRYNIVQ